MRQQQLESYLTHITGIVDNAIVNGNYATAILQIKGVCNLTGLNYKKYETASASQQQASLKRDAANNYSGY